MNKMSEIEKIVIASVKRLGEEEGIKAFKLPSNQTEIRKLVDSMSLVALSVDIEEVYEETFGKEIRVLNEDDEDFAKHFENVSSLISYVAQL